MRDIFSFNVGPFLLCSYRVCAVLMILLYFEHIMLLSYFYTFTEFDCFAVAISHPILLNWLCYNFFLLLFRNYSNILCKQAQCVLILTSPLISKIQLILKPSIAFWPHIAASRKMFVKSIIEWFPSSCYLRRRDLWRCRDLVSV